LREYVMDTDGQEKKPKDTPSPEPTQPVDPEEAKKKARRKLKPVGPIMKPLSDEEIKRLLYDPEDKEREHLLDAMPKGPEYDDQDPSNP
jgi:hypothetical protein